MLLVQSLFKETDAEIVEVETYAHLWQSNQRLPGLVRFLRAVDIFNQES